MRTLISTDTTKYEYRDTSTRLIYTDEDPNNPGKLLGTYDGTLLPSKWDSGTTWNKEHTWPKSRLKLDGKEPSDSNPINADLFNLRAAKSATNGSRGNRFFDDKDVSETFYPNLVEGGHDFRGDVARICFYMYVRWDGLKLINAINSSDGVSMGNLTTLLKWAKEDPVDAFETQKNDRVYQYQGNRNPFIDYPTLYTQIDFTK